MSDADVAQPGKLSRQEAGRRGGQARMAKLRAQLEAEGRSLGDYQREIRGHVSAEACRANGAKGAAATLERHGYAFLHTKVVEYRLAHPSQPERQMMEVLDGLGFTYQREFHPFADGPHQYATLDFFLPGFGLLGKGILVNGKVHNGDPLFNPDGSRPQREAERLAAIRAAGIPVLVVDADDLRDPERVTRDVQVFLTAPQYQSGLQEKETAGPNERSAVNGVKPQEEADEKRVTLQGVIEHFTGDGFVFSADHPGEPSPQGLPEYSSVTRHAVRAPQQALDALHTHLGPRPEDGIYDYFEVVGTAEPDAVRAERIADIGSPLGETVVWEQGREQQLALDARTAEAALVAEEWGDVSRTREAGHERQVTSERDSAAPLARTSEAELAAGEWVDVQTFTQAGAAQEAEPVGVVAERGEWQPHGGVQRAARMEAVESDVADEFAGLGREYTEVVPARFFAQAHVRGQRARQVELA